MTEILRAFWKEKRPERIAVLVSGILFAVIFWIYEIPVEIAGYAFLLVILWNVIWFTLVFIRYEKRQRILEENQGKIRTEAGGFPEAESRESEMYQELIRQLYEEKKELESSVQIEKQELSDYYSMWVHQIKTPIFALRLLLQESPEENKEKLSELFKIEQYVEMVLGYLRTEDMSSDLKLSRCSLDRIIRDQIHKYAGIFVSKKLTLTYESISQDVLTDEKWLGFVIGQILSNALKYTRTGGIRIYLEKKLSLDTDDVSISIGNDDCNKVENFTLVIEDTGIGIRAEDIPRIFEKGYTGVNGRDDNRATGIGLYLSNKIMRKLGHRLYITSTEGKGTKVFLEFSVEDLSMY